MRQTPRARPATTKSGMARRFTQINADMKNGFEQEDAENAEFLSVSSAPCSKNLHLRSSARSAGTCVFLFFLAMTQGWPSQNRPTLGWMIQSLWDWVACSPKGEKAGHRNAVGGTPTDAVETTALPEKFWRLHFQCFKIGAATQRRPTAAVWERGWITKGRMGVWKPPLPGPLLHKCVEEREKTPEVSPHEPAGVWERHWK